MSRISATCAADWAALHRSCAKDQSSQRSSSRSRFHSSPFRSARNNGNRSNDIRQPKQGYILVTHSSAGPSSSRTEQSQPIRQPLITLTNPGITPEEVAALRQQILDLSTTIHSLDER
ncbi:22550_t:CDS:2, partial [Rhizophagus irregularis]